MKEEQTRKPAAIVYTSNAGHTEQYARLLESRMGLSAYSLKEAKSQLAKGSPILYLGWIYTSHVKGYYDAMKSFDVCAVCGVGLCDNGTMLNEVRRATGIQASIPLFTLQGGLDRSRLKGMNKLMISMLTKGLSGQKTRSPQETRMLELLQSDTSYVREENLQDVLAWWEKEEENEKSNFI